MLWLQGVVLPQLRVAQAESAAKRVSDDEFSAPRRRQRLGEEEVIAAVSHFVHGNTLQERKIEIADRLPLANTEALLRHCRDLTSAPDTWRTSFANILPTSYWLTELQRALVLLKLDALLVELDDALSAFCNGVSYLEPLRATAQRYYRREELSVDELDPKGLNTAFFIQGLANRERESLNEWLKEMFGFQLDVKADKGHAALHIRVDDYLGDGRNMADVGLGYSQLTPVAIQLWAARQYRKPVTTVSRSRYTLPSERREYSSNLVVVEQPELHLHPAFQAKLADVFVASVAMSSRGSGDDGMPMRIVAETHSASLVTRLGELVGEGRIDPHHINVLVFESDPDFKGATKVRVAEFDEKGVLRNWPIGFFDY